MSLSNVAAGFTERHVLLERSKRTFVHNNVQFICMVVCHNALWRCHWTLILGFALCTLIYMLMGKHTRNTI